ncbi:MAG TPA: hypothetical protein ENN29_14100, partial [Candidatus Hydrogenedentes bacterium]|nr:hypothetical protein [Candidatus Hydrogenedentota bacterium]
MHRQEETERRRCASGYCHSGRGRRGAALIIALSVLLVLLSIAITFALIVRYESEMSQQTFQAARAENLLDGVLAKAMYRLNRDLEDHPDALSLDHSWRSWYSGAAMVGKFWMREMQGEKSGVGLHTGAQGLVSINIEPVERTLGHVLYVRFPKDNHIEPLFRGPRTEHWLYVPREQGTSILLYAEPGEAELARVTNAPAVEALSIDAVNAALASAGRPERIHYFSSADVKDNPNAYPFVTADFYQDNAVYDPDTDLWRPAYAPEQVNTWADVDSTGSGNTDALWMPVARDIDHHGDGIDNTLDGIFDPYRDGVPLLEPAPFVYHGLGLPDPETGELNGDGLDNNYDGVIDELALENKLFLTVPLPGMVMQVDLNSDGVFDESDYYRADPLDPDTWGPVYVRLPETVRVNTVDGKVYLGMDDVDVLDNDHDLMVNNFRAYAYVGPHNRLTGPEYDFYYSRNQIPSTRAVDPSTGIEYYDYNKWLYFENYTKSEFSPEWAEIDRNDPTFVGAHHRGYHDINVDAVFDGPDKIQIFYMNQNGVAQPVSNALRDILRAPNALRITCSGEPVSEIVGRAAVHITDEAGKANVNVGGGFVHTLGDEGEGETGGVERALNMGVTPFEYETRLLPKIGILRAPELWGMRTGAAEGEFELFTAVPAEYEGDISAPGYGLVDDDGNALLLAFSGRDDSGSGLVDDGLRLPRLSPAGLELLAGGVPPINVQPLAGWELGADYNFAKSFARLGRLEGIDEPGELRLFNPWRNLVAENIGGLDYGAHGDRLLLRKEELKKHHEIGAARWEYLRNIVTVNSDTRNIFHAQGVGVQRPYLKIDPNYATHQQLAATLLISGRATNIIERVFALGPNTMNPWATDLYNNDIAVYRAVRDFAEGLRQFDMSYTGRLYGQVPAPPTAANPYVGAYFPADPVLQTMRLAVDIASARDRSAARHKLVTENILRNPDVYARYLKTTPDLLNPPFEQPNERERIVDNELLPVGDIQEYLQLDLGITTDQKRLIATDLWWKNETETTVPGEDRLFQYVAASSEAVKINELMVRPVRRVEAETLPALLQRATWWYDGIDEPDDWPLGYVPNLDPAYYPGMLLFDVITPQPFAVPSLSDPSLDAWHLRSAYDTAAGQQPILGER